MFPIQIHLSHISLPLIPDPSAQVIKFEREKNVPKEFVKEEKGVHKSVYRAEKQGSSMGMSLAESPMHYNKGSPKMVCADHTL